MLWKPNKLDYTNLKTYPVISLLNLLGKLSEKVVANRLAEWCKVNHIFHRSQIGSRRQRSTIDVAARVVSIIQKSWTKGKMTSMLLIDVKDAFNHVSRNYLLRTMERMNADGNLMR